VLFVEGLSTGKSKALRVQIPPADAGEQHGKHSCRFMSEQALPAVKEKQKFMAEVNSPKATNRTEADRERESCAAKLETYAAILKINQGFSAVVAGLKDLKTAGLLNEEWANSKERIDDLIQEVWGHQAMLNSSVLNLLTAVEESDAIQCIGRRMEKQSRRITKDPAPVRVPQSADHRGRPN
jgi:hypothetical protein